MSQVIAQDKKQRAAAARSSIIVSLDLVIAAIGKSIWENNRLIICRWMYWACVRAIVNDRGEAVWIKGNYWGGLKKPIPASCTFTFGTRSGSEINTPLSFSPPTDCLPSPRSSPEAAEEVRAGGDIYYGACLGASVGHARPAVLGSAR